MTRGCLEILVEHDWQFVVQTRSPLVVRDRDIIEKSHKAVVGITVTTANDDIRKLFEPDAPPISSRIKALDELHRAGIRTFAMIAPLLPGAEELPVMLKGKVDRVLIDRMNYYYANWVDQKHNLRDKRTGDYFEQASREIVSAFKKQNIEARVLF